jgi:hypothetical protein
MRSHWELQRCSARADATVANAWGNRESHSGTMPRMHSKSASPQDDVAFKSTRWRGIQDHMRVACKSTRGWHSRPHEGGIAYSTRGWNGSVRTRVTDQPTSPRGVRRGTKWETKLFGWMTIHTKQGDAVQENSISWAVRTGMPTGVIHDARRCKW